MDKFVFVIPWAMKNPDPLGDRYPISGPSWRMVLQRCEDLTKAEDEAYKAERRAAKVRKAAAKDIIRAHEERPDSKALAAQMQAEMDSHWPGR